MSSFENVLEVANAEMKEVIVIGYFNCNFLPGARCQGETKKAQEHFSKHKYVTGC